MDALEQLLHETEELAATHGMHAYMVGSKSRVFEGTYLDDGRLFKISPMDVPETPILEVELRGHLRIYKHRNSELTSEYKERKITLEWVTQFIVVHAAWAAEIRLNKHRANAAIAMQILHDEIASLKAKLTTCDSWLRVSHKTISELETQLGIPSKETACDPMDVYKTSGGNDWREQK